MVVPGHDQGPGHDPGLHGGLYGTEDARGGTLIVKAVIHQSLPGVAITSLKGSVAEGEIEEEASVVGREDRENKINRTTKKEKREIKSKFINPNRYTVKPLNKGHRNKSQHLNKGQMTTTQTCCF